MSTVIRTPSIRTKGSIAVECAIVLPILLLLISGMLFFARVFWCYTVAQKAAHDGARFLATTTLREIMPSSPGAVVPAALVAQKIAIDEVAELTPGNPVSVEVQCYNVGSPRWSSCLAYYTPQKVLVSVTVSVTDDIFAPFTTDFTDGRPITFTTVMATDYVGN